MRGAVSSSLVLKITASFRKGSMRWNGMEGMAPRSLRWLRTFGDSFNVSPPTTCPTRRRARPSPFSSNSTCPG